jgi:hypothetical protein
MVDPDEDVDVEEEELPIAQLLENAQKLAEYKRKQQPGQNGKLMELKLNADAKAAEMRLAAAVHSQANKSIPTPALVAAPVPATAVPVTDEAKKRRGRPPGSKNVKGVAAKKKLSAKPSGNYCELEDVNLTKAFVNVSTDPTRGTNQTADDFWNKVHVCFGDFMIKDNKELYEMQGRAVSSLRDRFQRKIGKETAIFNKHYARAKSLEKSGWSNDDYLVEAKKLYLEDTKKEFEYAPCLPILWNFPRFDWKMELSNLKKANPEEPGLGHSNPGSAIQGMSMERTMGSKAAKRLKKELESRDKSNKMKFEVSSRMANASASTARAITGIRGIMKNTSEDELRTSMISQYIALGMLDKAKELLAEAEQVRLKRKQDEDVISKSVSSKGLPSSVLMDRDNTSPSETTETSTPETPSTKATGKRKRMESVVRVLNKKNEVVTNVDEDEEDEDVVNLAAI